MDDKNNSHSSSESTIQTNYQLGTDEISLIELINVVLKNRRTVVLTPLVIFVLVICFTFLQSRTYSTSASFMPQSASGQRSLSSSVAAQFGFSIPSVEGEQSAAFYSELIQTREILKGIVDSTYTFSFGEEQLIGSLSEFLKITDEDPARRREKTLKDVRDRISVSIDRETGLVTFSVQTRWAELSQQIAQRILDMVNRFNMETRQSQATAEKQFIEERLKEVEAELREAEDDLQEFLQKNRQWHESAELGFIHDRLERKVNMRQQVVTSLTQAYEQAKIDEVRDTPVITIVEKPEAPVLPDRRRLLLKGMLALILGGMLGIFGAFGHEFMIRGREREADEFDRFTSLKRKALDDLRHPWRLLKG